MSWWSTFPLLLVTGAIFFVPGLLIAWASRARGFALVALAPALTVTAVSVAAMVAPFLGLRWSIFAALGLATIMAAVAFLIARLTAGRWPFPRMPRTSWKQSMAELAAVLLGAVLVGRRLVYVFGRPEAISQTFDNVFHLNAIRYILDTGSASSITVSSMTGGGFYPAAWHDMVSLLVSTTGTAIPVAVNTVNICIGALVWPIGCIYLTQQIVGRRVVPSLVAGILAAGFGAFPILMLDFGVLYPNVLAISLLPVAIGASLQALGLARKPQHSPLIAWLLLIAVLPGLTLAHPSSTMALIALLVPALLGLWWRGARRDIPAWKSQWKGLVARVAVLVCGSVILIVLWKTIRPVEAAAFWPPVETTGQAIGEAIASSAIGRPVSWVIMILALVGLTSLIGRRRQWWLVGMYGVLAALFIIVASFQFGPVRTFFTGVWYNDPPRLAALLPVVILPVAVVGALRVEECARWVWHRFKIARRRRSAERAGGGVADYAGVAAVVVLFALLIVSTQQGNVRTAAVVAAHGYQLSPSSALLSSDELALIDRLDSEVPQNAVMAGNPWNGSALAYALADRKTLQLHILGELPDGAQEIYDHLDEAATDPAVCTVVRRLNVDYVLDFGHKEVHGGDSGFRGLDDLVARGVAKVIDSEGPAKLYKLTVCH